MSDPLPFNPTFVSEEFTPEEEDILRRYFTNTSGPVFALVNLPEVVKGALFARYSRSHKSLRRLFLDEFVGDLDISGDITIDATVGLERAEQLYKRVFVEYGDDSVAQLGGVHLACEQVSNLLSKVIEWGRLMAYLEQSTRYLNYAERAAGRFRYYRPPEIMQSPLAAMYVSEMDKLFESYAGLLGQMVDFFRKEFPKGEGDSDFAYRQAVTAKAYDTLRGMLPSATQTNVGIYGNGQTFEYLMLRMRAHPLAEARSYAEVMLAELRKVIPSFLKRVDVEDRGVAWTEYLADTREGMETVAEQIFGESPLPLTEPEPIEVRLVDFDPEAERKFLAAALFSYTHASEEEIAREVDAMGAEDRMAVVRAYTGMRRNRRHRPGRALELPSYRFEVLCDYGAFRDLQRHRMLTMEWQRLSCSHGYVMPDYLEAAGHAEAFHRAMERSAEASETIAHLYPDAASYAVAFAYRVRFNMQMNAREAMHLTELRSMASGHESYRYVAREMHRQIAETAGHTAIAEMMRFVGKEHDRGLERLDSEKQAEKRRSRT